MYCETPERAKKKNVNHTETKTKKTFFAEYLAGKGVGRVADQKARLTDGPVSNNDALDILRGNVQTRNKRLLFPMREGLSPYNCAMKENNPTKTTKSRQVFGLHPPRATYSKTCVVPALE